MVALRPNFNGLSAGKILKYDHKETDNASKSFPDKFSYEEIGKSFTLRIAAIVT